MIAAQSMGARAPRYCFASAILGIDTRHDEFNPNTDAVD
jgi:hypothetical protein